MSLPSSDIVVFGMRKRRWWQQVLLCTSSRQVGHLPRPLGLPLRGELDNRKVGAPRVRVCPGKVSIRLSGEHHRPIGKRCRAEGGVDTERLPTLRSAVMSANTEPSVTTTISSSRMYVCSVNSLRLLSNEPMSAEDVRRLPLVGFGPILGLKRNSHRRDVVQQARYTCSIKTRGAGMR